MEKRFKCEIGDLVKVDYDGDFHYQWMGLCTWTDGYKYSFAVVTATNIIDLGEITWTSHDLTHVKAEVINESR